MGRLGRFLKNRKPLLYERPIVKPSLMKALNHFLRVPTHSLPFSVVAERAAADYPRYFFEGLPPRPVEFRREDCDAYLGRLLAELEGKAVIHSGDFNHERDYSGGNNPLCGSVRLEAQNLGCNP